MKQIHFFYDRKSLDDRLVLNFDTDESVSAAFLIIGNARGMQQDYVNLNTREGIVSLRIDYAYARVEDYEDMLKRTFGEDNLANWRMAAEEWRTKTGRFAESTHD